MTSCACINTKYSVVVCEEHKCRCPGCDNKMVGWGYNVCEHHELKCFAVECNDLHYFKDYCGNHKCVIVECVGKRFYDSSMYCDYHSCKHKSCGIASCDEMKIDDKDSCELHLTKYFATDSGELHRFESGYCIDDHRCDNDQVDVSIDCKEGVPVSEGVEKIEEFCHNDCDLGKSSNVCVVYGCKRIPAVLKSKFCYDHACKRCLVEQSVNGLMCKLC